MNAEKIMTLIENMDETDRTKLIEQLYAEYIDNGRPTEKRERDVRQMDEYGDSHLKEHNEGFE